MLQVLCPVVVGRALQLEVLDAALARARGSAGSVAFLTGEAGIGKSRLAREAEERARAAGMEAIRGRAPETSAPISFRPIAEAIQSALRRSGPPDAPELVAYRPVLRSFVPEWSTDKDPVEVSPFLLLEGIVRLLRVLARRSGLLLVLEDLHWADADTLSVVEYLADNLSGERVLCLATIRSDEPSPALGLADALGARRIAEQIPLNALAEAETEEMVRASLDGDPAPALLRVLAQRAEGVPFLIEEMLSAYVASGGADARDPHQASSALPASYRELVRARLNALDRSARSVVGAAALLGRSFEWSLLPAITGLDSDDVLRGLRAAAEAQLISTSFESGFRFRHALVPETITAELLPPERADLSRRAAIAIEDAFPGLPGDWCERAADLREDAGDRADAATHLMEAATRASNRFALATAEVLLDRARSLISTDRWHRMGVDRLLIDVLAQAGKTARIEEIGDSLLEFYDAKAELMTVMLWASWHLPIARALAAAGKWPQARMHVERARELATRAGDDALLVRLQPLEAESLIASGDVDGARTAAEEGLRRGRLLEMPDVICEALMVLGAVSAQTGDADGAADYFARASAEAARSERTKWQVLALLEIGALECRHGSTVALEEARELAAASGAVSSHARAELLIGMAQIFRFEVVLAQSSLERSLDQCRRYRLPILPEVLVALANLHARRGDADLVQRFLNDVGNDPAGTTAVRAALALARDEGSFESAVQAGAPTEAALRTEAEAIVLGREGNKEEAADRFQEADESLAGFPWERNIGRRHVAEAAITDGWGAPTIWLRESIAFFEAAGLDQVAAACKSLLRRAGAPVPRKGRGESIVSPSLSARGVTSREMDVLRLVQSGLSNRDIATRLFVSPRTVETHVASLTRKLGLDGRAQLVAFAPETG